MSLEFECGAWVWSLGVELGCGVNSMSNRKQTSFGD